MSSEAVRSEDAWRRLRSGQHEAKGISIPTVASNVVTIEGAVRHALGEKGEARLLVPVSMHERLQSFSETPALRVTDATYQQDGRPIRFIDLTCMTPELDTVFAEVGEVLLDRIQEGIPAQNAVRTTLGDFRALLLQSPKREVSDSEIIGLVGELMVLCRLLNVNPTATEAWRGPAGERHDFRNGNMALEVKTTSRKSDFSVSISAIDQLDPPGGGTLHLVHIILERDPRGPINIEKLAAKAQARASEPGQLKKLLELVGCTEPQSEDWNRLSFSKEAMTSFEVRDGFPKVSSTSFKAGTLPQGVTALEYVIDLAQASGFALSSDENEKIEARIAG